MTILDEHSWGVHRLELTAWLVAFGCLVALLAIAGRELRRNRPPAGVDVTTKACVHLDDKAVMDIYRMGRYTAALTQEVEQRITRNLHFGGELPGTTVGIGTEAAEERISRYVRSDAPIDVIGVIIKALDDRDGIIHANLLTGTVRKNRALARSLDAVEESGPRPPGVRLSQAEAYVLLRGKFQAVEAAPGATEGDLVFMARYAPPGDLSRTGRVRVTCTRPGLSDSEAGAQTRAGYCLGTVHGWDAAEAVLEVHAIAVFR
ncbi:MULTISPECIES: hypothetical protein [Kitasatospora]|uniref:hypothetical protein n=1 Tax=Kitasatospora TaxID=2063 RepID=UPI00068E435C|nr:MULTISPECIES: hypothetical protein [Kitasatospora]